MSTPGVSTRHTDAVPTAGSAAHPPIDPDRLRWCRPAIDADPGRGRWTTAEVVWQNQRRRKLTPPAAGRVRAMPLTGHRRSVEHRDDEQDWERAHLFTALALATRRWSVWSIASIASIAPSPP